MGEDAKSNGSDAAAKPSTSTSSSSSAARPLQGPVPAGRKGWELWRTRFVLDERYAPIKVRTLEERKGIEKKEGNLVGAEWKRAV